LASRRRVDLAEALEEAVHAVGGDADAGVADGEVEAVEAAIGGAEVLDGDEDVAGAVNLMALPMRLMRTWRRRVLSPTMTGGAAADPTDEVEVLLGGLGAEDIEGVLEAFAQVEGALLELELAGFDLGEVEDVVDEAEEESPEVEMVSASSRCSMLSWVSRSRPLMPMMALRGVRISWDILARNSDLATVARAVSWARVLARSMADSSCWLRLSAFSAAARR
jgi:hypothetical protein